MASKTTDGNISESKDSIIISRNKIKYINSQFKKVTAIMYDYKCDVKLKCGNANFKAHREVLSDASDYFSAMFSHNMREKEQDVIELLGISPAGISVILDYFYHGFVTVEPTNIEDILEAARFFQVEWLVEVCCKFLVYHLSIDSYTEVLHLSDKYFLGDLRGEIFRFLANNLQELAKTSSFFQNLSLELLSQFLKEDIYMDITEDYLLYVCHKWVKTDLEKRKAYLLPLLRLIRFSLMEPEGIERMPKEFLESPEILDAVEEARHYLNNISAQSLYNEERFQSRGSRLVVTSMVFIDDLNEVVHKDMKKKNLCYEQLGDVGMEIDFEFASSANIGNFMYAAGGYGQDICSTNRILRFDPRTRSWTELASMSQPRTSGAICSSPTHLFICGGVDHQFIDGNETEVILKTCETYDPSNNTWTPLPDLVYGCFAHAVTYHNNNLYMSGGISAEPNSSVPSMSVFKLKIGEVGWEPVRESLFPRQGHSMTAVDNKIYCIGGKSGASKGIFQDSLHNEMFDVETNQWTEICQTPTTFGSVSRTVALNDKTIYFLGVVMKENNILVSLNSYDTEKDEMEAGEILGCTYCKVGVFNVALPPDF